VVVTVPQMLTIDSSVMLGMDNGSVIEGQFLGEIVAPVRERMKGMD